MAVTYDQRILKGMEIAQNGQEVKRLDESRYKVKSQSGNGAYLVSLKDPEWTCECADYKFRHTLCKHIHSVNFSRTLRNSIITSQVTVPRTTETQLPDECPYCKTDTEIVKRGTRKIQRGLTQLFWCKSCKRRFVADQGFTRRKASPHAITASMDLFFKGISVRKISDHLKQFYGLKVNASTVLRWIQAYIELMKQYANKIAPEVSETWHADETMLNVNGKWRWLWNLMDSESRFLISSRLTQTRKDHEARNLLLEGYRVAGKAPAQVITDGLPSYSSAMIDSLRMKGTKHIRKPRFVDLTNNNRIERLHGSMKDRTKVMRAFDSDATAQQTMKGFQVYYNFIRPHMGLNGYTPAEVANVQVELGENKWRGMIDASVEARNRPPRAPIESAKYRRRMAVGVIRKFRQTKNSKNRLRWLQGQMAYLRSKGLTELELDEILKQECAEELAWLL